MRMVKTTIQNPKPETWKDVIAETSEPNACKSGGGYFFATYMKDALSQIKQYDKTGKAG